MTPERAAQIDREVEDLKKKIEGVVVGVRTGVIIQSLLDIIMAIEIVEGTQDTVVVDALAMAILTINESKRERRQGRTQ